VHRGLAASGSLAEARGRASQRIAASASEASNWYIVNEVIEKAEKKE